MIWNQAPHRCSTYTVTSGSDAGGGTQLTFALAQSNVPCLVNTASARTVEMYAQQQIQVSHTVGVKSSLLTTPLTRGMKIVTAEGESLHVEGIRSGRAFMGVPAFTYADCSQLL